MVAFVLILLNLLVTLTAFSNYSKQEENTQQTTIETFASDEFKLSDYNTDISFGMFNELPRNIGRYRAYQATDCPISIDGCKPEYKRELNLGACSAEKESETEKYWVPRIGES